MTKIFDKYDKFKMIGLIIEGVTGVVGGSLVLTENHPYITLTVLALGAASSKFVGFLKDKEIAALNDKKDV